MKKKAGKPKKPLKAKKAKTVAAKKAAKAAKKSRAAKPARKPAPRVRAQAASKPKKSAGKAARKPVRKVAKKPVRKPAVRRVAGKAAKAARAKAKPARQPVKAARPPAAPGRPAGRTLDVRDLKKLRGAAPAAKPVAVEEPVVKKKAKFKADELRKLRAALLSERERLVADIRAIDDQTLLERPDEGNNHQPGYSLHLADSAADNQEVETALGVRNIEAEQLASIDEALRAIERGDYGICKRCGEVISIERLLVKPMARYCVPCRRLFETGKA